MQGLEWFGHDVIGHEVGKHPEVPTGIGELRVEFAGEQVRDLRASDPTTALLVIAAFREVESAVLAMRAGADGVLQRGPGGPALDEVLGALRRVAGTSDVPAVVIEFVASRARDRKRDYEEKRAEYAAIGVKEYWVIDRFRRTLTVCRGEEDLLVVKEDQTYQTDLLPGFELPLADLFAVADRWGEAEE